MNALPQTTLRRLQKIPQLPLVWEGDRRPLPGMGTNLQLDTRGGGECIVWVDGSEGFVRAMDVVTSEMGQEAVVRTLLRAIEKPHSPAAPARPQKIIVRDRELQFFLRGALQNLDINIDYVPDLPLINELFQTMETKHNPTELTITPRYESKLREVAAAIWNNAPWELMADYDILAIEINRPDIGKIYVCVMGMLGREYGVILYRSLESMKQFRYIVMQEESVELLEKAFLGQDCWFLNYDTEEELEEEEDLLEISGSDIRPLFGSVHPLEGMRPILEEEEAIAVYLALVGLLEFVQEFQAELELEEIPKISKSYKIPLLDQEVEKELVNVKVATMPELTVELLATLDELGEDEDEDEFSIPLREDLVPEGAFLSLGMVSQELLATLRNRRGKIYQSSLEEQPTVAEEGLPVILIQTTRPKAKVLIEEIIEARGIKAICFNPGEDPDTETNYDLGILQTGDGSLHIFAKFIGDDPAHVSAKKKWKRRCQKTKGCCGLIVAMGVTGASQGNPQLRDMMALFETRVIDSKELGMGVLELGWELGEEE
ncbi:MAG: hypothetical protein DSM107014_07815 [Gomphosphaeria aponina SAG 52.96 = DSM 107014]|uniref:Uncharacterized protein n=1 Tax=Gomphosphaeria aponina SAG 52.96 = DSM 107014 TaxID=1521640 RepID=A0A941GP79_9CHRO|nr:hypothetical protein [Gomphosphaeria aponina SAG 52.96 = DSM 107014]